MASFADSRPSLDTAAHDDAASHEKSSSSVTRVGDGGAVHAAPDDALPSLIRRISTALVPDQVASPPSPVAAHSAFSQRQRIGIIALASLGSIWSPFTANVYFPAIPAISRDLNASLQAINLTVVVYLISQGVAPSFWAACADVLGRRPVYVATMIVYVAACAGLSVCPSLGALFGLRAMQAAGSASTIALGAAVVGDVTSPSQRGLAMGVYSVALQSGNSLGPVTGGLIAGTIGWRYIFTVLGAGAALATLAIFLLLPETVRSIVGDGSRPPPAINRPIIRSLCCTWTPPASSDPPRETFKQRLRRVNVLGSLMLLFEKDLALILAWQGLSYAIYTVMVVSLSTLTQDVYGLSTIEAALCYLPNGIGMVCAGPVCGILLNRSFRHELVKLHARKRRETGADDVDEKASEVVALPTNAADVRDLSEFPIELARLKVAALAVPLYVSAFLVSGWVFEYRANLAIALVFQFALGVAFSLTMSSAGTLCVDVVPGRGASVTASQNLVRCLLGACSTSATDPMLQALGPGRAFTILAGITVAISSLLVADIKFGPRWRAERKARQAA